MAVKNKEKIYKLSLAAVLTALIFVMAFTPLGYLKVGVVSITFLTIPVVIGAIIGGPSVRFSDLCSAQRALSSASVWTLSVQLFSESTRSIPQ